jgi:hypothetical protein
MQVFDDRFQAIRMVLQFHPDCLDAVIKKLRVTYQWRLCSRELLMMGKEVARNL